MEKGFDQWIEVKKSLDKREQVRSFQERQVWWCGVGVNVGFEVLGKGRTYSRPVLIILKFSRYSFWGVPMTSKLKALPNHCPIRFDNKEHLLKLEQLRLFDARRLENLMGYLPVYEYYKTTKLLRDLFPGRK